jgi:hypothetical protein
LPKKEDHNIFLSKNDADMIHVSMYDIDNEYTSIYLDNINYENELLKSITIEELVNYDYREFNNYLYNNNYLHKSIKLFINNDYKLFMASICNNRDILVSINPLSRDISICNDENNEIEDQNKKINKITKSWLREFKNLNLKPSKDNEASFSKYFKQSLADLADRNPNPRTMARNQSDGKGRHGPRPARRRGQGTAAQGEGSPGPREGAGREPGVKTAEIPRTGESPIETRVSM